VLNRQWAVGDQVEIELDFSLHFWVGDRECAGKSSIYRGPILLTYDRRFNDMDPGDVPPLDARSARGDLVESKDWIQPWLLVQFKSKAGQALRLCDFASAGAGGSPYRSWLEVVDAPRTEFSRTNPLRTGRIKV
jgi:hypothetical protein